MTNVTAHIESRPVFVTARNSIEAEMAAVAKFERGNKGPDGFRSSLNHHTTVKPLWRVDRTANGLIVNRVNI